MLDILLYLQHFNSLLNTNLKCGFTAKIDCLLHKEECGKITACVIAAILDLGVLPSKH